MKKLYHPPLAPAAAYGRHFLLLICLLLAVSRVAAADYYWVGGSGMWSDHATHWATMSGGSTFHVQVPTSMDNVHFDANSFPAGGTVTIDQTIIYCRDMDWTGATNNPVFAGDKQVWVYGSMTLIAAMQWSMTGPLNFLAFQPGKTVTSAGHIFTQSIYFEGVGGEWSFMDDFTTLQDVRQNTGTLRTNGHTMNSQGFYFQSGATALYLSNSTLNIGQQFRTSGPLVDAGTSHIIFASGGFMVGRAAHTFYKVTFQSGGLAEEFSVSDKLTFTLGGNYTGKSGSLVNEVWFGGAANIAGLYSSGIKPRFNTATLLSGGNFQGESDFLNLSLASGFLYQFSGFTTTVLPGGTLTASGTSCSNAITFVGSGASLNTSGASPTLQFLTVSGLAVSGGGTITANSSIDLGGNTGWNFSPPAPRSLFWVGGDGNWSDAAHWSLASGGAGGACAPSAFDDVRFDAASGFGAGQSVTMNSNIGYCHHMNWTGVTNSPEFKAAGSKLYIYGSLTLASGMNFNFGAPIYFRSTQLGETVTSAGQTFKNSLYFEGAGGEWSFTDDFTGLEDVRQNTGTLRTNGHTMNIRALYFQSGATALYLSNSTLNIGQQFRTSGPLVDAGTSHVIFANGGLMVGSAAHTFYKVTFQSGGLTEEFSVSNKLTFTLGGNYMGRSGSLVNEVSFGGPGTIAGLYSSGTKPRFNTATFLGGGTFQGASEFLNLSLAPGFLYQFSGFTTTLLPGGTLTASGTSCANAITFVGGAGATLNTSGASQTLQYVTASGMEVAGGGTITANSSIDLGGNTGWNFSPPAPRSLFWVGGGGNWNDPAHWSLASGGTGGACLPSAFDDVRFDAASGFGAGQSVMVNTAIAYCHDMDWTGVTNSPEFKTAGGSNKLYINGSLKLVSGMNFNFGAGIYFRSTQLGEVVTSAGQVFKTTVYFEGVGGEWSFMDDFNSIDRVNHSAGTLRTNGHTVSILDFACSGGTSLYLYNSNLYLRTFNSSASLLDAGTSHVIFPSSGYMPGTVAQTFYKVTFQGGGLAFDFSVTNKLTFMSNGNFTGKSGTVVNEVEFVGSGTIQGTFSGGKPRFNTATFHDNGNIIGSNDFGSLTFSAGKTYLLQSDGTQTIDPLGDFVALGNGGFPIEIKSSVSGPQATLYKDGDPVCLDFLYLTGIAAAGTGFAYAGSHSDNVVNNSGWIFADCPPGLLIPPPPPTLDPNSILRVQPGEQAKLMLDNFPDALEAVWFNANLTTELYASTANDFRPTVYQRTVFYGALRNTNTGSLSELLPVTVCAVAVNAASNAPLCVGAAALLLTESGSAPGAMWEWTGPDDFYSTDQNPVLTSPTAANSGPYTVVVTDGTGCTNSQTIGVSILTLPVVSCPPNFSLCPAALPFDLANLAVSPSGGAFSGPGVSGANYSTTNGTVNTVTYTAGGSCPNACSFTITVNDTQAPSITCPGNIVRSTDAGQCSAVVTYASPTFSDNCTGASLLRTGGLASGSAFQKGPNMVNWKVTDGAGLVAVCGFTVTVNDVQAPTITCPPNQTKGTGAGLCSAVATFANAAFADNCAGGSVTQTSGLTSGSHFPKGNSTVTFRATDAVGLTKTCTFRITVNDTEAPSITCPQSIATDTDLNSCSAVETYSNATFADNCSNGSVVKISGLSSGSAFPKGTNTVVWKATDGAGLTKTCSFTVTVTDTQLPTVNCPMNISVTAAPGQCSATVSYANPTATDNCGVQSLFLLSGLASGSLFPAGVAANVWRAIDNSGGSQTCAFTVTVTCGTSSQEFENRPSFEASVSKGLKFEVPDATHGSETGQTSNFKLSPNPATTEVWVWVENMGENGGELTVSDVQGRAVWRRVLSPSLSGQPSVVDASNFPPGVFFVTLRSGETLVTKRLVVTQR